MPNATQIFSSELARCEFTDEKKMTLRVVAPISGVVARDLDAQPTTDVTLLVGASAAGAPVEYEAGALLQMHKSDKTGEYIVETVNPDGSQRGSFAFVTRITS